MPIKLIAFFSLYGLLAVSCAHAEISNVFQYDAANSTSELVNDGGASCPKTIVTPYFGHLLLKSKYDQSDPSKSTLKSSPDKVTLEIKSHIDKYTRSLSAYSDYAVKYAAEESYREKNIKLGLSCHSKALSAWANSNALLTDEATMNGKAVRKWALSVIASTTLKLRALTENEYKLTFLQKIWLDKLAKKVVDDYTPRLDPGFKYFNNHDYWAGWAVAATGTVLENRDYVRWGLSIYERSLTQIELVDGTPYGYLPTEIARKSLAANYTHFAITPLVMINVLANRNNYSISDPDGKFDKLVNFSASLLLNESSASDILQYDQKDVPPYKALWVLPYLSVYEDKVYPARLYEKYKSQMDEESYSMIGGYISLFYIK
ncbi:MAG: alginate lyase family protein [Colwellia sp.]|nr:alginate lyase family protein [Colwellia sp.]